MKTSSFYQNRAVLGFFLLAVLTVNQAFGAEEKLALEQDNKSARIDLAICLDASNSMDGLINSAKQRLWDVVNELASAKPVPELRVALFTYGNDNYSKSEGWVRKELGFTSDLDAVNQKLFSVSTKGGTEYVGRVVEQAVDNLSWSEDKNSLKLVFVAGNESADQDTKVSYREAIKKAAGKGIQVNAIYCGSQADTDARSWEEAARLGDGRYAYIEQSSSAVASAATPMDSELVTLNQKLNATYLAYGKEGEAAKQNQLSQDSNAQSMSMQAAASRAVTKSSSLYRTSSWDLVGALKAGKQLQEIPEADLPAPMQKMNQQEREQYTAQVQAERSKLEQQIRETENRRQAYLKQQNQQQGADKGFDAALKQIIRDEAQQRGFKFDK